MTDVAKALRRAFQLGQTYWQQADSESYKQNKLSDATGHKFEDLVIETVAALTRQSATLPDPIGEVVGLRATPEGTREFWGYFYDAYKPQKKIRIYDEDELSAVFAPISTQEEAPNVLAQCAVPYEGYVTAFYELAALMGIGAQPESPEQVWREQMLPKLTTMLATSETQPAPDHKLGDTAIDIVMSIDRALRGYSPTEVLDENSPIRDSIRDLVKVAGQRQK